MLPTVTQVLEQTDRPMQVREIHEAAEQLLGEELRWSSVKGTLSAHTIGGDRRFQRIKQGCYGISKPRS